MAGKGDKWRATDWKKYFENLELINNENTETPTEKTRPGKQAPTVVKHKHGKIRYIYK